VVADPWVEAQARAYPNGHVYFLIGDYEQGAEKEYVRFYEVSTWLSKNGYKPVVIANARLIDIQEAVMNPHTTGIIYSSHASSDGRLWDADSKPLPKDIFVNGAKNRLQFYVLSACHGQHCVEHYEFPKDARQIYWNDRTTTLELKKYLYSQQFRDSLRERTAEYREKCMSLWNAP
jgi:proteasome lid subunit RPN8/RPN11